MEGFLFNAKEELKRVDHLIYVSLKYTRTADVLMSVINRMINAYDQSLGGICEHLRETGKIEEEPKFPGKRVEVIQKHFAQDKLIMEAVTMYTTCKRIHNAEFTRANEYRRNVTMTSILDDGNIDVTIDTVTADYKKITQFLEYIEEKGFIK
ncbi:hypothetical protein H6504_03135 [Candidatus Woesearchaeota archaeon]|nr:hypothetical protein [Candidatus Woesearchaeota archaeon]